MNEDEFFSYFSKQLFKNNILSLFSSKCTYKWSLFLALFKQIKIETQFEYNSVC